MKVLLVNPPCGPRTIGMRYICRIEPLGLEQIGAAVSGEHETRLVDMQVRPADLQATLKEFMPDVAGVTTETVRVGPALDVLRTIRRAAPDCINVIGGHHPTVFPEDFNDPAVDLVALGEGFIPLARSAGPGPPDGADSTTSRV
jgi:hopanoid C-3 methylase